MEPEAKTQISSAQAWRLRHKRHDEAIHSAEVRRLVRLLRALGPLPRASLARISHARRWRKGCFDVAVSKGIRQGKLRQLPFDFLAASESSPRRADPEPQRIEPRDRPCARSTAR
jgi:hypothetical protein